MSDITVPPPLPGGKPARKRWSAIKVITCIVVLALLEAISWWFDIPAFADPMPPPLAEALAGTKARCYVYRLLKDPSELERGQLWRIDGDAEEIDAAVHAMRVLQADKVPAEFWKMAPHYWPDKFLPGMKCYTSGGYRDDVVREHYGQSFVVTDVPLHRAYVWYVEFGMPAPLQ